ncbi:MAG: molybdopterin-binding protein [Pseudomonadota bacterium]
MKFGTLAVTDAEGAILAHSIRHGGGVIKKGTRLDASAIAALTDSGVSEVICARLDADDVHEDEAAYRLACQLACPTIRVDDAFTGRANLFATEAGVLVPQGVAIDAANRVDEAITVATLDALKPVVPGEMVGTVKIIPFAVPDRAVAAASEALGASALSVAPFRAKRIGVVATMLPTLKPSVMDKTRRILDGRLEGTGSGVIDERRVAHDPDAVAKAIADLQAQRADLILVYGASAIVDRKDVVPDGIERAGGVIRHFGMPVDPGNLMLMAEIDDVPVIGAPGCARSPKENGFDWVLQRLLADIDVTPEDVQAMGVGGLLRDARRAAAAG